VNSVHAFADSNLGFFFLVYMGLVGGASLLLILDRRPFLRSERPLDSVLSRESAFLFNNLMLVVACFAVLWGTMFPVLSEWVRGTKITVGPPFFNNVNVPIGLFLLFLTGVGPLFAWRKTSIESLKKAFFLPGLLAVACFAALLAAGIRNFYTLMCLTLCVFVTATIVEEFYKATKIRMGNTKENALAALVNLTLRNKRRYGGYVVHFGIVLIFVGLTGNAFNKEVSQTMAIGDELKIGEYTLKLVDYREADTPNYVYGTTLLDAYKNGQFLRRMKPERRFFKTGDQQSTTEVSLRSTPKEDLYLVFAGMAQDGRRFEIKAHVNPLVFWVWFGAAVMVFGTLITLLPDRKGAFAAPQLSLAKEMTLEDFASEPQTSPKARV
jgi:cytochrome c-type biogenesis protein CcmF